MKAYRQQATNNNISKTLAIYNKANDAFENLNNIYDETLFSMKNEAVDYYRTN